MLATFPITLQESYMASPNVKHFIFSCNKIPPFHYEPGQFITIHFERDGKILRRSYSIANPPCQDNRIEFAAGYIDKGPGTELLFNLKPNDKIHINGPFGRLILKEDPKRYILVATSTGITPYCSMMDELKRRLLANPNLEIVILQGVQTRQDILYGDQLLAFAKAFPQVTFRTCLSREKVENLDLSYQVPGYVQHIFPKLALHPEQDKVYLCGNASMIDDAFADLKNRGFPLQHIIREKYISN